MDLSQISTPDLQAFKTGNLNQISTQGLMALKGIHAPSQTPSFGRTVLDQAMQGIPLIGTFTDEATDALGALGATAATNPAALFSSDAMKPELADSLANSRKDTQDRLNTEMRDRPVTSIASQLGSGLLGSAAALETAPGQAIADSIGSGGLGARVLKGVVTGAASGAAYGAGAANEGERLGGAEQGATIGGLVGGAIPAVSSGLSKFNLALGPKSPIPNADQLRSKASDLYQLAEQKGGILKPDFTNQFIDDVQKLRPQTDVGKIVTGETPLTKLIDSFSGKTDPKTGEIVGGIANKPISLQAAQEIDEHLGNLIDANTVLGKVDKNGKQLLDVQNLFRDAIENAGPEMVDGGKEGFDALKEARSMWSTSAKLSDVERIISKSSQTDNPASALKTGFRTLYNNSSRLRGFNDAEKEAIKNAADSGIVTDLLKTFGSRLGPIASGVVGNAAAGPIGGAASGLASYGLSSLARNGATAIQMSKAQRVAQLLANGGKPIQQPLIQLPKLLAGQSTLPEAGNIYAKYLGSK